MQNPLAHILICGKCGSYMQRRPYAKRGETTAVQCTNTACNNISSKLHIVEEKVVSGLKYWFNEYKLSDDSFKPKKNMDNINYYKNMIKQLNYNITKQKNRLSKVCEAYEDGIYGSDVYQSRCIEIQETISQIEHQIIEYQEQMDMHTFQLHGGLPTITNFVLKTKTRTRNSSTSGTGQACAMRYRSSFPVL